MKLMTSAAALAAALMFGGATVATAQTANVQGTAGAGVSTSDNQGSTAAGLTAGGQAVTQDDRDHRRHGPKRAEREDRRVPSTVRNSTSTYGSGTVYTDRNTATGGVTAGGSATGTGSASSGTTVSATGETAPTGGYADVYGDATANAQEREGQ